MPYTPTTWVDNTTPAIDAANLNHLETGVSNATTTADAAVPKSTVTATGDLIVATGNATVGRLGVGAATTVLHGGATPGYSQIVNADVDAAAAVAYSKLNLASSIVNADVSASAAIAYSKLNLAASVARTDMAAGFKTTVGTMAAGPPASPTTNDIWIATDVDANGTCWTFRYNSAEATYKWEFVGGASFRHEVATDESTASATYTDLATVGPTLTLPRAGDYEAIFSFDTYNASANAYNYGALKRGAAATADADSARAVAVTAGTTSMTVARTLVLSGMSASDVVKVQYKCPGATTANFRQRSLFIRPIRVI